jgi:AraC-like DNA-binding protein
MSVSTRRLQTPYEFPLEEASAQTQRFRDKLDALLKGNMQALNLAVLSKRLGLSPRTLSRRFSDELQMSPGRWIQERRLDAAKQLLESTDLSVSEVCYRVGYQNVASFSRLFSREMGLPPGEFRRQNE